MRKRTNIVSFEWIHAGYCIQKESFSLLNGSNKKKKFYAGVGIIHHPKGIFLFDTGYSNHFFKETRHFPYNLYAKLTPVVCDKTDTLLAHLVAQKLKSSQIKGIFISHFHADHISGLKDFPNIPIYCLESCYSDIKDKSGLSAVRRGFIPKLLPDDFRKRLILLNKFQSVPPTLDLTPFTSCIDIFNDNTIYAIRLDGHAKGQMGLYINTSTPVFFVADSCWSSLAYRNNIAPPWYVRYFLGNNQDYLRTLDNLYQFHKNHPEVLLLPSHCDEFWRNKDV